MSCYKVTIWDWRFNGFPQAAPAPANSAASSGDPEGGRRNVFISFINEDKPLVELLRGQAQKEDSTVDFYQGEIPGRLPPAIKKHRIRVIAWRHKGLARALK